MDGNGAETELDTLGDLVEDYLALRARGEPPSVEDFAAEHPQQAEDLRALLPTLILLEESASQLMTSIMDPRQTGTCEARSLGVNLPRRLGEYELLRELGRGGMGVVFEARQESLDRRVAIKILTGPALLADDRARRRFLREARIIARMRHSHIVPIHTIGERDGLLYYVMDLIEGTSLDQLTPRESPAETSQERARWVALLGIQAAEALAYAHGEGVLHRDIKPANFLLDPDGTLWLMDFGLARPLDDEGLTETGGWLGTLRYLAPECFDGDYTIRSDLYSLGLTLYELLVGVPAFPETNRARLTRQILETTPPPPHQLDPTVPPDLERIILRASAREPADRYPTATALIDDLRRFLGGQPLPARPTSTTKRPRRSMIARYPVIAALALVGLLLAVLIVWVRPFSGPSQVQPETATEAPSVSEPAPTAPESVEEPSPPSDMRPMGPPWGMGKRQGMGGGGPGPKGGRGPWGSGSGPGPGPGPGPRRGMPPE